MSSPAPAPSTGAPNPSIPGPTPAGDSDKAKTTTKKAPAKKATSKKKTAAKAGATQAKAKKPTARKKKATTTAKGNAAASNQAILQESRAAANDLATQRAYAAARKTDPLWYRIEDIVPAVLTKEKEMKLPINKNKSATQATSKLTPTMTDQINILERALSHNGMTRSDVTPQAMACLLEYARRYTTEILNQGQVLATHSNRTNVNSPDLLLAAEMRNDHAVAISAQLPLVHTLSQQLNRKPLPPIPANCYSGVLLPPPTQQLTARTFDIVSGASTALRSIQKMPPMPPTAGKSANNNSSTSGTPSGATKSTKSKTGTAAAYGATRSPKQIPVKLKQPELKPPEPPTLATATMDITSAVKQEGNTPAAASTSASTGGTASTAATDSSQPTANTTNPSSSSPIKTEPMDTT